jgi:Nucleotidyl transferase AbiEii toxin, Type IV TA system
MSLFDFYIQVVRALDEIRVPYMIVGAFGAISYGLNRGTHDVDIIVALNDEQCDALAARFLSPRYYADADQMREGMQLGIMFNLIDSDEGTKADLVPLSREPAYQEAFRRRIRRSFQDKRDEGFEAWCARPEDIIIGKLIAWKEGQSAKHPNDIYALLQFDFAGLSDISIDLDYVAWRTNELGEDVRTLWLDLVARARQARK